MDTIKKLNRFTTLPILLDLLDRRQLLLLDPSSWDDKNDTDIILEYKRRAGIQNLFALCFTHDSETIHHWKTFSNGPSGCCIEFSAGRLLEIFENTAGLRHGKVDYRNINDAGLSAFELSRVPFLKRRPYQLEREYRIIWEGACAGNCFAVDLPLEAIRRITFSQQMPEPVFHSVKKLLVSNYKILDKKINRSTIYKNERWISYFK